MIFKQVHVSFVRLKKKLARAGIASHIKKQYAFSVDLLHNILRVYVSLGVTNPVI